MDELLKSVRLTDNIKLDVFKQGRRRKYVIFHDENNTKSEKYDATLSDDQVIEESLIIYNQRNNKSYKIIQDPYKDPFLQRTYGSGSPFYLNNGCFVSIYWYDVDNFIITSKEDNASSSDLFVNYKEVSIIKTTNIDNNGVKIVLTNIGLEYLSTVSVNKTIDKIIKYGSTMKDIDIIESVINQFISQVRSINGITNYDLKLCNPSNESNKTIEYIDPIYPIKKTFDQSISEETPKSPTQSTPKNKLIIDGLPKEIKIKAKENLPIFTVWTALIPKNNDYYTELGDLDEEYLESSYQGLEETGIDFESWKIQDNISNSQEDCVNYVEVGGDPADVKPYSSLDGLLQLAGKCARELGKNPKVKYENLRSGYKKGIHGLCPQGTLSVLYALTGVKSLGKLIGNADWFSFKSPTNPSGGDFKGDLSKTGYYNQKVKITQIDGSWKGTYLHNNSKKQWQIGDIVSMGYINGKNYGHIQIWTGYCWMSDFKQNSIQQNNVDVNSVALWRLNSKGIEAVNKQKNLN